jgi:hypothetical protein
MPAANFEFFPVLALAQARLSCGVRHHDLRMSWKAAA